MFLNLIFEQEYFVGRFEIEIRIYLEFDDLCVLMPEASVRGVSWGREKVIILVSHKL
jgi:hypothetical protein